MFLDAAGFIRCRGRIGRARVPYTTRFPILIPAKNYVMRLVIEDAHLLVFHNCVKKTLAQVRTKFGIVKGRQAVKAIIGRCFLCKKLEGLSYPSPVSSHLPHYRVKGGQSLQNYRS